MRTRADVERGVGSILVAGPAIMGAAGLLTAWYVSRAASPTLSNWLAPFPPPYEPVIAVSQVCGLIVAVIDSRVERSRRLLSTTLVLCALVAVVARVIAWVGWSRLDVVPGTSSGASFIYLAGFLHLTLSVLVLSFLIVGMVRARSHAASQRSLQPFVWSVTTLVETVAIVIIIGSST